MRGTWCRFCGFTAEFKHAGCVGRLVGPFYSEKDRARVHRSLIPPKIERKNKKK